MYYHIYNRGNFKQPLFICEKDYLRFFGYISVYSKRLSIQFLAYCIMINHFHFETATIQKPKTISKFMHLLCTAYSMYFNHKYRKNGHVFQGRYKARRIESISDMVHLSRYIHQNPVENANTKQWATAIKYAREYKWSSYKTLLHGDYSPEQLNLPNYLSRELLNCFGGNIKSFRVFEEEPIAKWDKRYYSSIEVEA